MCSHKLAAQSPARLRGLKFTPVQDSPPLFLHYIFLYEYKNKNAANKVFVMTYTTENKQHLKIRKIKQ